MSYASASLLRVPSLAILIAGAGVILGLALAEGHWLYALPIAGLVLLLGWPVEASLGIYALLLPFDSISRLGNTPDGRTLTFYAGATAAVVLLGTALMHDRFARPPRAAVYWLWFLMLAVLSVFWALDETVVIERLPTLFGLFGLYFAACCFDISERQFRRVAQLAVGGGFAAAVYSIASFSSGIETIEARGSLITGTQQADPNLFAASLLVSLALGVGLAISAKGIVERVVMATASFTIFVAVLLTMSRGALLALLAMAAIYAYRFKLSRKLLFVLSVVPLALLIVPALFFTRLQNALVSGGAGRLDIWTAGLSAITVFGLQGSGLENFPIAYERFAGFAPVFRGYERAAHNIYLQTAVELGILGVVLLLCAIRLHLKDLRPLSIGRITSPQPMVVTCEAMAIGMLVASFFVGTLWQKSFWMVWIFCTLAARTHKEAASVTQPVLHRVHYLSYAVSSF